MFAAGPSELVIRLQLIVHRTSVLFHAYGTTHLHVKFLCAEPSVCGTIEQFRTQVLKAVFHVYG
jgi:hypothetical protein